MYCTVAKYFNMKALWRVLRLSHTLHTFLGVHTWKPAEHKGGDLQVGGKTDGGAMAPQKAQTLPTDLLCT
jgi:hypothetical protein